MSPESINAPRQADSLGRRYVFKLLSNAGTIPLHLVMDALLPRALGPAGYGNFSFVTTLLQNFTYFLDMGTSTCLATSLAKRPWEFGLVAFYGRICMGMLAICLLFGLVLVHPFVGELLMPGVPLWLALPAALWAYLTWAGRITRSMNDALGITVPSELMRMTVNVLSAVALLALFYSGVLDMPVLFLHQFVFLALGAVGYIWVMRGSWTAPEWRLPPGAMRSYGREFWRYSSPIFITALCSVLFLSAERWLLQYFSGSEEQGYFSLAYKVGVACFMFVSAMTPLLMREFSVAHGRKDLEGMGRLMDRFAPMLYAVAAWFSCFTCVEAVAVVRLFGGEDFTGAILPVQIMALYPIHQAYGQVGNVLFYAAGETRILRNISILVSSLGLVCAWLCLAPGNMGGLGLGSMGLAVKMTVVQFFGVNVLLLYCRKAVPYHYGRNLLHQALCPLCLLFLAWVAREGTVAAGMGDLNFLPRFFISGICYGFLTLGLVAVFPFALGVTRKEIAGQSRRILTWFSARGERQ